MCPTHESFKDWVVEFNKNQEITELHNPSYIDTKGKLWLHSQLMEKMNPKNESLPDPTKLNKQQKYGINNHLIYKDGKWEVTKALSPVTDKSPNAVCLLCEFMEDGFCLFFTKPPFKGYKPYKIPIPLDEPVYCDNYKIKP